MSSSPPAPLVSVIIVNYNTRDLLLQCLDALEQATDAPHEVIVVDNGSSDGSADAVEQRFRKAIVVRHQNVGFGRGNNAGLQQAAGRFVLLLNSDVVVKRGCVDRLADHLLLHPEVGAVGPRLVRPSGQLDLACRRGFPTPRASFFRVIGLSRLFSHSRFFNAYNLGYLDEHQEHEIDAGSGACLLVRRSTIDQVGFFDPDFFMFGEDLDLCFRIKEGGWKVMYLPSAEAVHLKGQSTRLATRRMLFAFHSAMWTFHSKHYAADLSAFPNGLIWASIWARWAVLRARAVVTRDQRVSA
ncbi:MAG: glycosyltransferase family 2 protein [Candidatus Dormibacteraeota bacterium]|nr:glycosyltransferase family 2 protein [Candidatus Dormibacteraeota bacterium]